MGGRRGATIFFAYTNNNDGDKGLGALTLSDVGCKLTGSFQSTVDPDRHGDFNLTRCPE